MNGQVYHLKLPFSEQSPHREDLQLNFYADGGNEALISIPPTELFTPSHQLNNELLFPPQTSNKKQSHKSLQKPRYVVEDINQQFQEGSMSPSSSDGKYSVRQTYPNQSSNLVNVNDQEQRARQISINVPNQLTSVSASQSVIQYEEDDQADQGALSLCQSQNQFVESLNSKHIRQSVNSKNYRIEKQEFGDQDQQNQVIKKKAQKKNLLAFQMLQEETKELQFLAIKNEDSFKQESEEEATIHLRQGQINSPSEQSLLQNVNPHSQSQISMRLSLEKVQENQNLQLGSEIQMMNEFQDDEEPNSVSSKVQTKRISTKNLEFVYSNSGRKMQGEKDQTDNLIKTQNFGFTNQILMKKEQRPMQQTFNILSQYTTTQQRYSNEASPTARGKNEEGAFGENDSQMNQEMFSINLVNSGEASPQNRDVSIMREGEEDEFQITKYKSPKKLAQEQQVKLQESIDEYHSFEQNDNANDLNEDQIILLENQNFQIGDGLTAARQTLDSRRKSLSDINLLQTLNDYQDDRLLEGNLLKDSALHSPFLQKQAFDEISPDRNKRFSLNNEQQLQDGKGYILRSSYDQTGVNQGVNPFVNEVQSEAAYPSLQQQIDLLQSSIKKASERLSTGKERITPTSQDQPFRQSQHGFEEESSLQKYMNSQLKQRRDSSKSMKNMRNRASNQLRQSQEKRKQSNRSQDSIDQSRSLNKSNQKSLNTSQTHHHNYNSANYQKSPINQYKKQIQRKSMGHASSQPFNKHTVTANYGTNKHYHQISDIQRHYDHENQKRQEEEIKLEQARVYEMPYQIHFTEQNDDTEEVLEVQMVDIQMEGSAFDSRNEGSEVRDPDESQPILRAVSSKAILLEDYQKQRYQLQQENQLQIMRPEGLIALQDDQDQQNYDNQMPIKTPLYQELQDMKFDSNPQFKNLNDDFNVLSPQTVKSSVPMFDFDLSEFINVAYMFAQPIYFKEDKEGREQSPNSPINVSNVFSLLQDALTQTQNSLKLSYSQATVNNFYHIMSQNPEGIHLIGSIQENALDLDSPNFVIEKESGEAEYLSSEQLSDLLGQSDRQLDFLFVQSSSDMDSIIKFFSQTQLKHVICARYDQDATDREEALQTFVLTFYGSLYASNISVCEAFQSSIDKVVSLYGQNHEESYQLLTSHISQDDINSCRKIGNDMKGSLELVDEPFFQASMPQSLQDNMSDMRQATNVISQIVLNRLVVILGYSGSGKSYLLGPILQFISQRNFFTSGIIYLNLRGIQQQIQFLKLLTLTVMSELPYFEAEKVKDSIMMNTEQCFKLILQFLKNISQPLLFVFDNTEEAQIGFQNYNVSLRESQEEIIRDASKSQMRSDSVQRGSQLSQHASADIYFQSFDKILEEIMSQNPFIKVLITTSKGIEESSLNNVSKSFYILEPHYQNQTGQKIIQRLERQLTQSEVDELIGYGSPQKRERSKSTMIPNLQPPLQNALEVLENHELFEIIGSNSQASKICSQLLNTLSLQEVYDGFKNDNSNKILLKEHINCLSLASLRLSLEMACNYISKLEEGSSILQLFYLICLIKIPVTEKQLRKIWGLDYQKHLEVLFKFGLVQMSWEDPARVVVSSLVSEFGRAHTSLNDMAVMINELSKYLNSKSEKVYRGNSKYRKSKSKGLYKCKLLKWRNMWIELTLYQVLEALNADYSNKQLLEAEESQISKIQISKVYDGQLLSRTPSQPTLKKVSTLRSQASSQLVKQKTQTAKGAATRTSFNGIQQKQQPSTTKSNQHLKKASWLPQNYTPNLTSSQIKIVNDTPVRRNQRQQLGNSYASAIVSHSRNKHVNKQNSSTEKYSESYLLQDHTDYNSPMNEEASIQEYLSSMQSNFQTLSVKEQIKLIEKDSRQIKIQSKIQKSFLNEDTKLMSILRDPSIIDNLLRPSDLSSQNYRSRGTSPKSELLLGTSALQNYQLSSSAKRSHLGSKIKKQQSPQSPPVEEEEYSPWKDENMHELEKTILKFMMNLFLFREMEQLYQFIQSMAFSFDGCKLYLANLYRIKGLLYQSQQNTQRCVEFLKKGKQLYKYKESIYGEALSRYSIALFQKKLLVQQNLDDSVFLEVGYGKLIKKFEKALVGFKEVNHLIGQALCHNQLSLIFKTRFAEQKSVSEIEAAKAEFNHHQNEQMRIMQEYQDYPLKKKCPHVKRVQGPEFSLMLELVQELLNINLFPLPNPISQQKYELQAIQEDEMEESVMFSEDNNYKETLKEQQEVLQSFQDYRDEPEQQSTPKSRVSRLNQKEITQIYTVQNFQQTVEEQDMMNLGQQKPFKGKPQKILNEDIHSAQTIEKQQQMPVIKLNISQIAKQKKISNSSGVQENLYSKRLEEKIISGQNTIEVFDDSEDSSPNGSFREQPPSSSTQERASDSLKKSSSRYKQQVTPDNDILLSASKPKSAQRTNEYGFISHYLTEEDNRIYTCSPQESSINQIHQTEEIQMNQQAYFSQTSKRSMRVHSQLEVVEEESHNQFELIEMMTPPNQRLSLRNKAKVKTSMDMTDKNRGQLSASSGALTQSISQISNLKQRHSMEAKLPKKLNSQAQPPKPNANKSKVLQINIKQLK